MGLMKPPNILTFLAATVLVAIGFLSQIGVALPGIGVVVAGKEFWLLFAANVLFILGCITRGF